MKISKEQKAFIKAIADLQKQLDKTMESSAQALNALHEVDWKWWNQNRR